MTPSLDRRLKRIDQRLETLLEELSGYDNDTLNRKPADGGWSALQVMHHLMLAEEGSIRYVRKKLSFDPDLKDAGLGSSWRATVLNFYFLLPFKFKAPPGVDDAALPEKSDFEEVAKRWRKNREELREYLQGLPQELFRKSIYRHPFAGRMSLEGMAAFFDGHFARHHKQIKRTLREVAP